MWHTHLKIALRNLQRDPGFTTINVVGLAVGLAACSIIALYVQHERSYDEHHEKAERIVRITTHYQQDDHHWATTSPPIGPALEDALPEVETVARVIPFSDDRVLRFRDREFVEPNGVFADSTVFDVFTLPLVRGNAETALSTPYTVVLSENLAQKYFGSANPVGRTIEVVDWASLTVTGVMENPPSTTHLPVEFIISAATFYQREPGWAQERTWERFYTYALLDSASDRAVVRDQLSAFATTFYEGEFNSPTDAIRLDLQPLLDIHLHSHLDREFQPNGDIRYVYLFSTIALLLLLLACVNYVNLATAQATRRRQEVGVRKALGANPRRLVGQFLGESLLLASCALVLAAVLIPLGLPWLNHLGGTSFSVDALRTPGRLASFVALGWGTGLLAGLYPALVLSRFEALRALHGGRSSVSAMIGLREGLVVFQFAVSIFLLVGTAVVYQQLQYVHDKPLGFDRERVAAVLLDAGSLRETVRSRPETVKQELLRHPEIERVSLAFSYPGRRYNMEPISVVGHPSAQSLETRISWGVDRDYLATLGVEVVQGRGFSDLSPADTTAWIINRAAVRHFGLENPIGKVIEWRGYSGEIVGVMEDFHYASLRHTIEPLALPLRSDAGGTLLVRVRTGESTTALRTVEDYLAQMTPTLTFRYSFLDDRFESLHAGANRLQDIFGIFAGLALLIACLGLFGLAAFTAQQRTKEIGIRKVLGATVTGIVGLLARDYLKLVGLAFIVAAPLAYIAMDHWLSDFAYRVELSTSLCLLAGTLALAVALVAVSYHAFNAARTDPTSSLRSE